MADLSFDVTLPRLQPVEAPSGPSTGASGEQLRWHVVQPVEKLTLRGRLPGAYGFDRIAASLDVARRAGVAFSARLAPALPSSWMVNNRATSLVFQAWLSGDAAARLEELCILLEGGPAAWSERSVASRDDVARLVRELTTVGQPSPKAPAGWEAVPGLTCALSKVLALLVPETVPLLDDAAVHVLTGLVGPPRDAHHPLAPPPAFVPCLDAFSAAVLQQDTALASIADAFARVDVGLPLTPAQVLDRLLWVDSWGHRDLGLRHVSGPASLRVEVPER